MSDKNKDLKATEAEDQETEQDEEEDDDELSFDDILTDKKFKSEFDRRVSKALKTFEETQKKKVKSALGEGEEEVQSDPAALLSKYVNSEIKYALIKNGVSAEKLDRAVRLIAPEEVLDKNEVSEEKLNSSVADLLKAFPELKGTAAGKESEKVIKIGADRNKGGKSEDDLIKSIFGNDKTK
ncbi:MAG: hypothetical protein LBR25_03170 [Erysipelotrichaceae bacterium]|jgi:hypothetical protein|nr:hypothetical protein [Erysipelotrichaceae bacterium]